MRYRFGSHILDLETHELRADGAPVPLEPRSFAVLSHLVAHRDRVVPKEELLDEVWGDRFVSESALTTRIKHCRAAVGDDGRTQGVISTVHRVGYRFVAHVTEVAGTTGGSSRDTTAEAPPAEVDRPPAPADQGPRGPTTAPHRPPVTGGLIGRDDDLAELERRCADHRVVTVTGPAGVGKSTLAARLGDDARAAAGHEAWMCDLSAAAEPRAVAATVLGAIGEGQQSDADPTESALRALERRDGLLVLDGCEHVLGAVGPLVRALLRRCPGVSVLATSRRPLAVPDESVLALAPLDLDAAVRVFCQRARDAGAAVPLDDPAVIELCRRLDRLPLALELAAARARVLGPGQLLELLSDRFRLLRASNDGDGGGSGPPSLHDAIAWSWEDLDGADQAVLARLSTLAGTFELEDAAGVAMDHADPLDAVDALERLVRRSLVSTSPGPGGRRRYRLLDAIADFAASHLSDAERAAARLRHIGHFTDVAERLEARMQTPAVDEALARMATSWTNLRTAASYAADARQVTLLRRLVVAVGAYADLYQTYEVLDWCQGAELGGDLSDDPDPCLAADALAVQARLWAHRGEHARARNQVDAAHRLAPSRVTELSLVWCAYYEGDLDTVIEGAGRLRELSRSGRGLDRGYAEGFAAVVATVRQEVHRDAVGPTPAEVVPGVLGTIDCLAAGFRLCTADPTRAAALLEAVVMRSLAADHRLLLGAAASTLTQITLPGRPTREAMATLVRTLALYRERGMWVLISADTVMAARLLTEVGDLDTAARLIGARNASGYRSGLSEGLRAAVADELCDCLGHSRFAALAAQGARWNPPHAADVAIAEMTRHLDAEDGPAP
jgi:predicted ATPase/DNA-binding winged helix-turn-helix (wHTH) protein